MRILYVVHQFFPEFGSGTERVTLNLARAAQRAGHRVEVLACVIDEARHRGEPCPDLPGASRRMHQGVPVTLLPRSALPMQADTGLQLVEPLREPLQRWLSQQRFDVMHVMHTMRMATVVAAAQSVGLPFVITLTDFFTACLRINLIDLRGQACSGPEEGRACERRCPVPGLSIEDFQARHRSAASLLAAASARMAPSAFVAERMKAAFPSLRFDVLPHGIDLLALRQGQGADPAPSPAGRAVRRLVFLGTLIPAKGLHLLLQALALAPDLPVELVVAGSFHHDESYRSLIEGLVRADGRVRLQGWLDAAGLARLLSDCDLLCLPSQVPESYSLVLHEAAAFGVPALVADRGAPALHVRAHGAGGVVRGDRPEDWAKALRAWVADPAGQQRWRDAVRLPMRIEEESFLYEGLYRQAAASARPAA